MLAALVNGLTVHGAEHALSIEERGLSYGDGVFETMLLRAGVVRFVGDHLARLQMGCERLGIPMPAESMLGNDIATLIHQHRDGIVKLIVTRGAGGRGYRATAGMTPTRIAILYPPISDQSGESIAVRWCKTRLPRNSQLAGIKHLNRLEHVLAQNEWSDLAIAEGLMLDTEDEIICATASNVFVMLDGVLTTPDLRFCGVRGVLRQRVLAAAKALNVDTSEGALHPDDMLRASEVFLTSAVRGIRPVGALDEQRWTRASMAQRLSAALELGT